MKKYLTVLFILSVFLSASALPDVANGKEFKKVQAKHVFGAISGETDRIDKKGEKVKVRVRKAQHIKKYEPTQPMSISIVLPTRNKEELKTFLKELRDPKSPNYRKYLSVEQFTERFGPTKEDFKKVVDFAKANKMKIKKEHINRLVLDIEGDVKDVEKMFNVVLGEYQHPIEKRTFFHPDKEPTVDLDVPILRIAGLDNYSTPEPLHIRNGETKRKKLDGLIPLGQGTVVSEEDNPPLAPAADCTGTCTGTGPTGWYIGSDMRKAYYPEGALSGQGQSVAIVSFTPYNPADVTLYFNTIGESLNVPLVNVSVGGVATTCTSCADAEWEPILDIVYAASMAPKLDSIRMYVAGTRTVEGWPQSWVNDVGLFNQIATDNISKQISVSWAWMTPDLISNSSIFEELEAQGQTVFAAAGDWGSWYPPQALSATTNAVNTTGATLLILAVTTSDDTLSMQVSPLANAVSDSKGNTWTPLSPYGDFTSLYNSWWSGFVRLYYSFPTSVGTNHTVTYTSNNPNSVHMNFMAFGGTFSGTLDTGSDLGKPAAGTTSCNPVSGTSYTPSGNVFCFSSIATGFPFWPNNAAISGWTKPYPGDFGFLIAYKETSPSGSWDAPWVAATSPSPFIGHPTNNACNYACFPRSSSVSLVAGATGFNLGGSTAYLFYPADHPTVTAVGGTNLVTGTNQAWVSESTWADTGGGYSPNGFLIPTWQQPSGIINTNNKGSDTYRNAPDVAMQSGYKFFTCGQGTCTGGVGGTSFATPLWAAFNALINQQLTVNGESEVGNLNAVLYPIGTGANYSSVFNDVTTGTNDYVLSDCTANYTPWRHCCTGVGTGSCVGTPDYYNAVTGYDLVTGWGSPKGQALIDIIAGPLADVTAPTVTILTSSPQSIETDFLTVTGTASDNINVSGCKFRVGAEPNISNGTACTVLNVAGVDTWSCGTSGYSNGSNTLYVACYDSIPNYSTGNAIIVNYSAPDPGISKLRGGVLRGCTVR